MGSLGPGYPRNPRRLHGVSTLAEVSAALDGRWNERHDACRGHRAGDPPSQRSVRAPLAEIAKVAETSGIRPPAIFVIGQVVAHAKALESPTPRPLRGARFGMFAPRSELSEALQDAGAEVLLAPAPLTAAARLVLGGAPLSGWMCNPCPNWTPSSEREQRTAPCDYHRVVPGQCDASLARSRGWPTVEDLGDGESPSELVARLRQDLDRTTSGQAEP